MPNLKNLSVSILLMLAALYLAGCMDMQVPTPEYIIKRPIGTDSVKIGMTKNQVKGIWGEPDRINSVSDKEKWGGVREEWVYSGRYSSLPVDAGYLSKTKKLYFDGDSLTNITEE